MSSNDLNDILTQRAKAAFAKEWAAIWDSTANRLNDLLDGQGQYGEFDALPKDLKMAIQAKLTARYWRSRREEADCYEKAEARFVSLYIEKFVSTVEEAQAFMEERS